MSSSPAANRAENRQPWVTYGMLVLCAIALTYSKNVERDVQNSADVALEKAVAYWNERPYLEPADSITEKLTAETIQSRRAEFRRDRSGRGSIGVPKALQSQYQEELDRLTEEALQPLSKLPSSRMGVRVSKPTGASYISHVFLHSGWLQLIGNGILLLVLGCYIERVWGPALFGVSALVSSLAAATAFRIGNPELDASLIGTTGMLGGLLAAFAVRFAPRWTEAGYCPTVLGGLCWLALSVHFGWDGSVVPGPTASGEMAGIASVSSWAIAGGFGCGVLISALVMLTKIEAILSDADPTAVKKPNLEPDLQAALDAREDGRSDEAFELLSTLLQRNPENRAALLAMWDVALDLGKYADASRAMLRVIRDEVRRNASSAVEHWLDLTGRDLHGDAEPALLIHIALMLCEADRRAEALSALQRALDLSAETESPEIAARIARASRSLDRGFTEAAAWRALGSAELSFSDRQNLEILLGELHREPSEPPAQSPPLGDAAAAAHPGASPERSASELYAQERSPRWEDPGFSGAEDRSAEELLTAVDASGEGGCAAEPVASVRPVPIDLEVTSRSLRVVRAQPIELVDDGIVIEIESGQKRKIGFDRVDAVSVVAIDGLGPKFVIVIDLVLNWMSDASEPLKVIRLRGDRFDPRQFAPGHDSPLDAMRNFTTRLLGRSNATALPDMRSVKGTPFASFSDLASYQRTVLCVDEEIGEAGATDC